MDGPRPPVKRTYGKRPLPTRLPTPPSSSPPSSPLSRKRTLESDGPSPLAPRDTNIPDKQASLSDFFGPIKRRRKALPTPAPSSPCSSPAPKPVALKQLVFAQGSLRSCTECGMDYMRGGEDEGVHQRHHARVLRGILWDKKRAAKEVGTASFKSGSARLLVLEAASARMAEVLELLDTVVSASPLPATIIHECKLILAVSSDTPSTTRHPQRQDRRERIIGAVLAQPIKWAMRVLPAHTADKENETLGCSDVKPRVIDSGDGVVCDPTPLPTPLGIHRLFVVPSYRRCGLARAMLDAAASHTVYGCAFDVEAGEVAFSQPTASGRAVMEAWGKGAVRIFVEEQ